MYISFYIAENRIEELKYFIRTELPTARFAHNPLKEGDKWHIALNMEVEDNHKLNILENKWYEQDNPPIVEKKTWWSRFISWFL